MAKASKGIRISDLAKELGVSPSEILKKISDEGIQPDRSFKTSSSIPIGLAETVKEWAKAGEVRRTVNDLDPLIERPRAYVAVVIEYIEKLREAVESSGLQNDLVAAAQRLKQQLLLPEPAFMGDLQIHESAPGIGAVIARTASLARAAHNPMPKEAEASPDERDLLDELRIAGHALTPRPLPDIGQLLSDVSQSLPALIARYKVELTEANGRSDANGDRVLVLEISLDQLPESVSLRQQVVGLAAALDEYHRSLGGHGLKIESCEISVEQMAEVPA
jgi:hypothetical protein